MPVRSKGLRSKTRGILTKRPRDRGEATPNKVLRQFPEGSNVAIVIDPAQHGGMPHKRFQGQTGTIAGKQGDSFVVALTHGGKDKTLVVRPEHLKQVF
ncbi:MAG: 50S ribosomal protein L21e [Thermoplasmatota archaeon]